MSQELNLKKISPLTPPITRLVRWDLEKMKEMGCKMVRKHIKIEVDSTSRDTLLQVARWHYWADRLRSAGLTGLSSPVFCTPVLSCTFLPGLPIHIRSPPADGETRGSKNRSTTLRQKWEMSYKIKPHNYIAGSVPDRVIRVAVPAGPPPQHHPLGRLPRGLGTP